MQSARHTSSKSRSSLTPPLTRRHRREHMGCDIHLYREERENGVWISADKWTAFDYGDDEKGVTVEYEDRAYTGRNYDFFSVLAGVCRRNEPAYSFEARGLPSVVCGQSARQNKPRGRDDLL